jgi:hypothetical protein
MSEPTKKALVAVLRATREKVCAYMGKPGHSCDCKFGATAETIGRRSENGSGCPELLTAASVLEAMTPTEFARVTKRMRGAKRTRKGAR